GATATGFWKAVSKSANPSNRNSNMNTLSIKQYQEQYPHLSAVPSITQSGSLAAVLERVEQKRARKRRRRARRHIITQRATSLIRTMQQRFAPRSVSRSTAVRPPRIA
ncbi:MAG: hypothetical protein ACI9MB_004972, partial [Verrucomicrobiales bacterium]